MYKINSLLLTLLFLFIYSCDTTESDNGYTWIGKWNYIIDEENHYLDISESIMIVAYDTRDEYQNGDLRAPCFSRIHEVLDANDDGFSYEDSDELITIEVVSKNELNIAIGSFRLVLNRVGGIPLDFNDCESWDDVW